jgi:hypothetical protein
MRLPEKLNHIPAIPRSLAEAGYATDYLYAGDIEIMNKKGYLIASGYQQFTSDKDFPLEQVNDSKWGVNDGNSARRIRQDQRVFLYSNRASLEIFKRYSDIDGVQHRKKGIGYYSSTP